MAWTYYTPPLPEGSRPNAAQLAELMAAFGERAAFQLNTFWSTTGYGLDLVKQPALAASLLEGCFVFWTGPGPGITSLCQPLDVALGGAMGNALVTGYTAPNQWWSGSPALFAAAATDLGVDFTAATALMYGTGAPTTGLLNADYFNVVRHAMQLLTAYSFDGATVVTPTWTYP